MTVAETITTSGATASPELIPLLDDAAKAATALRDRAIEAVSAKVSSGGKLDNAALEREQRAAHGLAWVATYVEALTQIASYAKRMQDEGRFGEMESLLVQIGAAEYAAQLAGGVMMSQGEMARLYELGVKDSDQTAFLTPSVRALIQASTPEARARVVDADQGEPGHRHLRRHRPRRDARRDPRRDAPLLARPRSSRMRKNGISRTNMCRCR